MKSMSLFRPGMSPILRMIQPRRNINSSKEFFVVGKTSNDEIDKTAGKIDT